MSTDELELSSRALIYIVQHYYSVHEFINMKNGNQSTKLCKLFPFVDGHGLIRAGGRLRNATISHDSKHPYILPKDAWLSILLCDYFHLHYLHAGSHLVQSMIQRKYWIIGARSLIRCRIHKCLRCHKL